MVRLPKNDLEHSVRRLERILGRRRLLFNPYAVSDGRLLEMVAAVGWGNEYDIVQMMILSFPRLVPAASTARYRYAGLTMRIGNQEKETLLPTSWLVDKVTLTSDASHLRSMIGKRPICNEDHVAAMEGKSYFLSHAIPGVDIRQEPRVAYRLHRLTGSRAKDAAIIRRAMTDAKLEMLEWLTRHVNAPEYLDCSPGFFDYSTPIRDVALLISRYPETPVPEN